MRRALRASRYLFGRYQSIKYIEISKFTDMVVIAKEAEIATAK